MILSHLPYVKDGDHYYPWRPWPAPYSNRPWQGCVQVCRCLRAVAAEFYFPPSMRATVGSLEELFAFLRNHPRVAQKIKILCVQKRSPGDRLSPKVLVDDTSIAELIQLVPNLKSLDLCAVQFADSVPSPRSAPVTPTWFTSPFPLSRFSISDSDPGSSLPAVIRTLSLFKTNNFSWNWSLDFDRSKTEVVPASLHQPTFNVRMLVLMGGHDKASPLVTVLAKLALFLAPSVLEHLWVCCRSKEDVCALGKLLARVGQNLVTIHLQVVPGGSYTRNKIKWNDCFDGRSPH